MSVIATVGVSADDFMLGATLSANPNLRLRLERVVPVGNAFVPYVWASGDDVEAIRAGLEAEEDVESFRVVDSADGEVLVRVEWAASVDGLLDVLAETDGTILEAVGEDGRWRFDLRLDDHTELTRFYRGCSGRDIALDLQAIHNPGVPQKHGPGFDLTDAQREALEMALAEGYFDVPRGINLLELADRLGVSDSAVSQRLRRGTRKLLRATLGESERR